MCTSVYEPVCVSLDFLQLYVSTSLYLCYFKKGECGTIEARERNFVFHKGAL